MNNIQFKQSLWVVIIQDPIRNFQDLFKFKKERHNIHSFQIKNNDRLIHDFPRILRGKRENYILPNFRYHEEEQFDIAIVQFLEEFGVDQVVFLDVERVSC